MGTEGTVQAHLALKSLSHPLLVYELEARETMNGLSRVRVVTVLHGVPGLLAEAVGGPGILELSDNLEGTTRRLPLLVTSVEILREWSDRVEVALELGPPEVLLEHRGGYRIFVEKTAVEVVDAVLEGAGLGGPFRELRLEQKYAVRPQCVQYDETDWAFATRLLAEEGIAFWFDAKKGAPLLVLADSEAALGGIDEDARVPFVEQSGMVAIRHFGRFSLEESLVSGSVHLREDAIRHPDLPFEGKAVFEGGKGRGPEAALGEVFEYPARVTDREAIKVRAKVRMAQLARNACVARGTSNLMRLQPGRLIELYGDLEQEFLGRYLVTEVVHHLVAPEAAAPGIGLADVQSGAVGYHNEVTLVPASTLYRPEVPDWPKVFDLEPAMTTGPDGVEIHVNDLGDVKLKMPWDRSEVADDRASYWARTLQVGLGGSMALPRTGWEVPVMYRDGDPERPLVLGRLYNGASPLPCRLPAEAASTCFQSATTPGGRTANEIRMGDSKGKEAMGISASHNQKVVVGGSSVTEVTGNELHDVGLSYSIEAKTQIVNVAGEQNINVAKNYEVAIDGARAEVIGATENNKVTGNRVVMTGPYTESIGAAQATQCIQAVVEAKGNMVNLVGGAAKFAAVAGHSETVVGLRQHMVGAARVINCKAYSERIKAAKAILAGASKVTAGGPFATSCASGTLKAASIVGKASGKVVFEGKTITLKAANVKTPGGTIGGGAIKVKGSNVTGTIQRKAVTKLGS